MSNTKDLATLLATLVATDIITKDLSAHFGFDPMSMDLSILIVSVADAYPDTVEDGMMIMDLQRAVIDGIPGSTLLEIKEIFQLAADAEHSFVDLIDSISLAWKEGCRGNEIFKRLGFEVENG